MYAALCVPNVIFPGKQLRIYVYCILHIIFLPKSKKLTKKKIVKYQGFYKAGKQQIFEKIKGVKNARKSKVSQANH